MEGGDGETKMRSKPDRRLLLKVWRLPGGLRIQFGTPLFLPVICQIAYMSLLMQLKRHYVLEIHQMNINELWNFTTFVVVEYEILTANCEIAIFKLASLSWSLNTSNHVSHPPGCSSPKPSPPNSPHSDSLR